MLNVSHNPRQNELDFELVFQFRISLEGIRAILSVALDWAYLFMSIGVESMRKYGPEVDFTTFFGDRTLLLLITNVFERTYSIQLRRPLIELRWGVHPTHKKLIL